jgi:hypothetical protein
MMIKCETCSGHGEVVFELDMANPFSGERDGAETIESCADCGGSGEATCLCGEPATEGVRGKGRAMCTVCRLLYTVGSPPEALVELAALAVRLAARA